MEDFLIWVDTEIDRGSFLITLAVVVAVTCIMLVVCLLIAAALMLYVNTINVYSLVLSAGMIVLWPFVYLVYKYRKDRN